ncbi:MAG: restriction endonuclease [Agriterribacter sp.]
MTIPDFQSLMLPLLTFLADGKEHTTKETLNYLADEFQLTDEQRQEMLPSRNQTVFYNRVTWAKAHLKMAALVENLKRGSFKITPNGLDILKQKPDTINLKFLRQIPEYIETAESWKNNSMDAGIVENETSEAKTPEEILDAGYLKIRQTLSQDLLSKVKSCSPLFFENLVVELLVKMGYGGSLKDAGKAIGKSGDEGIDGIIKEDKLGLDVIYVQAKRWEGSVGRPEIQKFVGALAGQGAKKGIFITTSRFTPDAASYVPRNETKIVLIDGDQLAQLMIDYNLGVTIQITYEIKKMDTDYFDGE